MSNLNSSIDPDLFHGIRDSNASEVVNSNSNSIEPQVAFLRKCIHPPSAVPSYSGLPTNDTRTQVLVQWTNMQINVTPSIVDAIASATRNVTAADLSTFDYAILSTSGARVVSIPFIYINGVMVQDLSNVEVQDNYDFENFSTDATLYRPNYKSITTYLNATSFNDTGSVAGMQFNPSMLFGGTLSRLSSTNYDLFRSYVRTHIRLKHIQLIDNRHPLFHSARTIFENFPAFVRDDIIDLLTSGFVDRDLTTVVGLDPNTTLQIINLSQIGDQVMPSQSQILNNSTRSYGGRARDGTFAVQRLNTIAPQWLTASNTIASKSGLYQCYFFFYDTAGIDHLIPLYDNNPVPTPITTLKPLYDTLWSSDMTWSIVRYDGLSLNSQTSVSTQLLIKKTYTGFEVQPAFRSAWAGMVRMAPKPDLMSMQLLMDRMYELKDVMPASYNFWGAMLAALPSILSSAGPMIKMISGVAKRENKREKRPTVQQITRGVSRIPVPVRRPAPAVAVARPSRIPTLVRPPARVRYPPAIMPAPTPRKRRTKIPVVKYPPARMPPATTRKFSNRL